MKIVAIDRLLASSALGLVLMLGPQAGYAQSLEEQLNAAVPQSEPIAPPTLKDLVPQEAPIQAARAAAPAPVAIPAPATVPATTTVQATADSATANAAVTDKLREMVTGKALDRIVSRRPERTGVEAFYKARDYAPLWVNNGAVTERAKGAITTLSKAGEVGLDAADYPTPDFAAAKSADELADAELKLTSAVLNYARQAQIGRIHFSRVAADIEFNQTAPDPASVLDNLAKASNAADALESYNPPHPQFKALRAKLADLRAGKPVVESKTEDAKPAPAIQIASGPIMRPGMKDKRVADLRKRLDIPGDKNNTLYDNAVVEAVKTFQTTADLDTDGNVGPSTLRALNGNKPEPKTINRASNDPIDTIIVNMERWRWLARDLGNPHVIVNVPDYRLTLWNNGKVYWTTKIVAGKPGSHATPMISAEMKFITVNPTWNVPPSIIEKEYLPALQEDPGALDRIGLKVEQAADGTVRIYQPPGAANALGRIRFNFPNKFLVYQHDTPDKNLFKHEKRAYSHGCMRVENPLMYGEKLLSLALPEQKYTAAKLESMFGGSEININFPNHLWVHLTYQTAFVDDEGKLQFREDVYGRDARMIAILKGSDRKVADIAVARPPNTSSKPVRMPVGALGGGGGYSGPNFFEALFGGFGRPEPVYRPRGDVGGPRYGRDGRIVVR
ncbi:murein L,D-transpeptidase [Pseudolabrys sp. FHR47]|uniref:L,D-transpeptidase family protein n=1 Tax=Pseudolabrys sp. FHR47 TaxID=2562284 RepID=UPI0010BEBD47|nr:L,D-transpeptidase family protein [Pseudolabrys sp. FHR47]